MSQPTEEALLTPPFHFELTWLTPTEHSATNDLIHDRTSANPNEVLLLRRNWLGQRLEHDLTCAMLCFTPTKNPDEVKPVSGIFVAISRFVGTPRGPEPEPSQSCWC